MLEALQAELTTLRRELYDREVEHGESLGSLALGISKTQFMEGRAGYSLCLDLHHLGTRLSALQLQWLLQDSGEYRCAVRGGQLFGERLVQAPSAPRKRQLAVNPGMACVVAGGTKGLGLQYGQQLVRQGCRALVLTSRSGLLSKQELIELAQQGGWGRVGGRAGSEPLDGASCTCCGIFPAAASLTSTLVIRLLPLIPAGAGVFVAQRDASDTGHNQQLAEWLHNHLPAVQTYAHAAGVLGLDLIPDLTAEQFARVVKPKASAVLQGSSCQC